MTLFLQHVIAGVGEEGRGDGGADQTRLIATLGLLQSVLYQSSMT